MEELIEALAESIDTFSKRLFQIMSNEMENNFMVSGAGVHYLLASLVFGARGDTTEQIENCLKLNSRYDIAYWKQIIIYMENAPYVRLNMTGKIFFDDKIKLKEKFLAILKDTFQNEPEVIDFKKTTKAIEAINAWCKNQIILESNDISKDCLLIDSTTKMMLISINNFECLWRYFLQFPSKSTIKVPFHIDKNRQERVLMMKKSREIFVKKLDGLNIIGLQYKTDELFFVILLPDELDGIRYLKKNIDKIQINYEDFRDRKNWEPVNLTLPKFKIDSTLNLITYLRKMGMDIMFTEEADLSGICVNPKQKSPLYVKSLIQKTKFEINESGSGLEEKVEMRRHDKDAIKESANYRNIIVDRPFFFQILDVKCKMTICYGQIVDPTQF